MFWNNLSSKYDPFGRPTQVWYNPYYKLYVPHSNYYCHAQALFVHSQSNPAKEAITSIAASIHTSSEYTIIVVMVWTTLYLSTLSIIISPL